jgi:hypothetical protein
MQKKIMPWRYVEIEMRRIESHIVSEEQPLTLLFTSPEYIENKHGN